MVRSCCLESDLSYGRTWIWDFSRTSILDDVVKFTGDSTKAKECVTFIESNKEINSAQLPLESRDVDINSAQLRNTLLIHRLAAPL